MDDVIDLLEKLQIMENGFASASVEDELLEYIAGLTSKFAHTPGITEALKAHNINPHAIALILMLLTTYFSYQVANKEIKGANPKAQFSTILNDIRQVICNVERKTAEGHA